MVKIIKVISLVIIALVFLARVAEAQENSAKWKSRTVWRVNNGQKLIALTFDDGPKPEFSQKLVDILDRYAVKATFFITGFEAEKEPDEIIRLDSMGHEIGNHTYHHQPLEGLDRAVIENEIRRTNQVIYRIIKKTPRYLRPPGGGYDERVVDILESLGMKTVNWTVNARDYVRMEKGFAIEEDYDRLAREVTERVMKQVTPGAIILFHNGPVQTVRALPQIIQGLKKQGYAMVTLSRLLADGTSVKRFGRLIGFKDRE